MPKNFEEVNQLAKEIEDHLTAVNGLASAIREDRAYLGSDPCEHLSEFHVDSMHHAIEVLSLLALRGFHDVLTKLEIPQ